MSERRATLVLVHGAWHGAWCWERVVAQLEKRGVAVRTLDLPSVGARPARRRGGASARANRETIGSPSEAARAGSMAGERPGEADSAGAASASAGSRTGSSAGAGSSGGAEAASGVRASGGAGIAGLGADAAAVRAVIDATPGRVVLCGHSYGGMAISLAAVGHVRVARLVYLCAFMPDTGQSLLDVSGGKTAPWVRMLRGGMTLPDLAQAGEVFYGDCDEVTRQWAIQRLAPMPSAAFAEPVPHPAWEGIPSSYVVCRNDHAIDPQMQRGLFAPRAQDVTELDSGHSPFLSQPARVAELLAAYR